MKVKYVLHDGVGDVIKDLVEMYDKGQIEGIMLCIKTSNDETWTIWSGMNHIEKLGALEVLKDDMKRIANRERDE